MAEAASPAALALAARQAARSAMASTYNGRPRPPEIGFESGRLLTLLPRGSLDRLP